MAVRKDEINIAVIIVVEKLQAPSAQKASGLRNGLRLRDVNESLVLVVLVQGEFFLVHVGDEEILPAVVVVVRRINAHSRASLAVVAEGYFSGHADLLPSITAAIDKEKILHRVVGDEEVHTPVIID